MNVRLILKFEFIAYCLSSFFGGGGGGGGGDGRYRYHSVDGDQTV